MKKYILVIMLMCMGSTSVYASVWGIQGLEIVPRTQWGAVEGWGKLFSGSWERYVAQEAAYESWLAGDIEDTDGAFARKKQQKNIEQQRYEFLEKYYPDDIRTLKKVSQIGGTNLVWPREYGEKTKIVIHHTAGDQVYESPAISLIGLQDIYKFHTLSRGWGDIGYNFIIDPFGVIYEGRAGGKGVVGGHTDWNNTSTIGVALMGNFDRDEPTDEAWMSLRQLVTTLAVTYDIDPFEEKSYFYVTAEEPYIAVRKDYALVGHQDVKATGCPGDAVYARLPALRKEVSTAVQAFGGAGTNQTIQYIDHEVPYYFSETFGTITLPFPGGGKVVCESLEENITITHCTWGRSNTLDIHIAHDGYPASGYTTMLIRVGKEVYSIGLSLVREKDLELLRQQRQQLDRGFVPRTNMIEKLQSRVPFASVADLVNEEVNVFMYELSTAYDQWEMSCDDGCILKLDDTTLSAVSEFRVLALSTGGLRIFIDGKFYDTTSIDIQQSGFVTITNYEKVYGGVPMNMFAGDISIQKQTYNNLEDGRKEGYVVINSVSFDDYMKGVGEISERQHSEKITVMSLLTKAYMLFYLDKSNTHPSIPQDSVYNAIDDPRMFQRYFGAGFSIYGKQWIQALEKTKGLYVKYDDYVPVLPYFHCSSGYTRSAKDAFGWKDTPWLTSVLDLSICESGGFEGHGVGMSGDGAEAMAQAGMTYEEILNRYYDGLEIVSQE